MCKCCMKEDKWKSIYTPAYFTSTRIVALHREKGQKLACTSECYAAIEINGITCCVVRTLSSVGGLCAVRKGFKSLQPHYAGTIVLRGNHLRLACKHASIWYWIGGAGKKGQSYYSSSWWGSIWLAWLGAQPTIMVRFVSKESLTREVCHLYFRPSDLLSTKLLLLPLWMMAKAVIIRPMFW